MTAANDFATSILTNTYILNDFGELAYIVCTLVNPPTNDGPNSNISEESRITRLKSAERQFRQHSILAALDHETLQLFTFYKKVDVVKDQRTLLSRFGFITRSNACTIAYKAAARVPDLLKHENSRLYRLFVTAILSSIKLSTAEIGKIIPIGLRSYLIDETNSSSDSQEGFPYPQWRLYRTELQVLPNGQIILTLAKDNSVVLVPICDGPSLSKLQRGRQGDPTLVLLAPFCQIARYTGGLVESFRDEGSSLTGNKTINNFKKLWKSNFLDWLKIHVARAPENQDQKWVELEIPLLDRGTDQDLSKTIRDKDVFLSRNIEWRTIPWPASLCYLVQSRYETSYSDQIDLSDEDPLQFMRDWISNSERRAAEFAKSQHLHKANTEEEDEPLFPDEGPFGDPEQFQPFGPPAFPASQTIYPTPPDAVMTHATPGMSSVDGVAMTPANVARPAIDTSQSRIDIEIPDADVAETLGAESSFYDEDLFEEMPEDNFVQAGAGEEPNWDFFDEPDFDTDHVGARKDSQLVHNEGIDSNNNNLSEEKNLLRPHEEAAIQRTEEASSLPDVKDFVVSRAISRKSADLGKDLNHDIQREAPSGSQSRNKIDEPDLAVQSYHRGDQRLLEEYTNSAEKRRTSSIYEQVDPSDLVNNNDNRYSTQGKFWFDPTPGNRRKRLDSAMGIFDKPWSSASSTSTSRTDSESMSLDDEALEQDGKLKGNYWADYNPKIVSENSTEIELDQASIKKEVQKLQNVFQDARLNVPSGPDFRLLSLLVAADVWEQDHQAGLAQIFVAQICQTMFQHQLSQMKLQYHNTKSSCDVKLDLSGINTTAGYSNLLQLINIKPSNGVQTCGRLTKIENGQISMSRGDRKMSASISILPFWDSLALQPAMGTKNVLAFCVYPAREHLSESCSSFLNRMADAYACCNLGSHSTGQIPGLTDDGLVEYTNNGSLDSEILKTCQELGSALTTIPGLKENIVIYMVSPDVAPASFLRLCTAFHSLFEAFIESLRDQQTLVEVGLQIVPKSFIASSDTLIVPPQIDYVRLALEVYSRLPAANLDNRVATSRSAVILSKVNNSVHFNLSKMPSSPLSEFGPSLHVAYSLSLDERWCSAAWTDQHGQTALSMSYCLRTRSSIKSRPLKEVLSDIWEISGEIMAKQRTKWRLIVVKNGFYDLSEVEEWRRLTLVESNQRPSSCNLILVTSELNPSLEFSLPIAQIKPNQPAFATPQPNQYGTPASSPQASMMSPDQPMAATPTPGGSSNVNASTPPEHGYDLSNEAEFTLVDPVEESWSIVLPYGLNQSRNILDVRPAQASGFLIKRRGSKDPDGFTTIGIHLIWSMATSTTTSTTSIDDLMIDIIDQFRGLVTLAVARNCINQADECVPWHISTAVKGSMILAQVM